MKLKIWRQLWVKLKAIKIAGTQMNFSNPKLKALYDASFRLNEANVSDTSFDKLAYVLTVLADRVGNFKQMNVEL